MFRGGFAWLNAVQNMSDERQWKRKEMESIPKCWSQMSQPSPGKRESLHLIFRKTLVPFIWYLRRLFPWFGDGRTRRRRFRLPCTFPPFRFICWTIIGIGPFNVFLYFIGTLRFGYSFLLACTDFFIFFARTLSFARINVVTRLRTSQKWRFFFNFRFAYTALAEISL